MFSHEHWSEVLWIHSGEALIPLFGVDVPLLSQGVGLSTKLTGLEADNQIELAEVLGPSGLLTSENLRGREILKIFVIGDNIHQGGRALQVVLPGFEGLENSKELLVMHVIFQLRCSECVRIEGDQLNLTIGAGDRKDTGNHIVRSIGFDGNQGTRLIVSKDGSCCEGLLQPIKGTSTVLREVPGGIFPSKLSQWDHNIRVIEYEVMVEVCKAKEGLDVLHLAVFRSITNSSDFVL